MYSLLMVDDDDLIRTGFQTRIPWEALGFDFWEPCPDGRQALAVIEQRRPDVLVTDVNMPLLDGLELCRIVGREYPDVLLVVLTGYDDFEYARTALRYRVWDYILKPLPVEELKAVLVRLRGELDSRRPARVGPEVLGRHLLQGTVPADLEPEAENLLGPGWRGAFWACLHLETSFSRDLPLPGTPSPESPVVVAQDPSPDGRMRRWKLLYRSTDAASAHRAAFFGGRKLVQDLRAQGHRAVAGLGSARSGPEGLPEAAREAEEASFLRFLRNDEVFPPSAAEEEAASGLGRFPEAYRRVLTTGTVAEIAALHAELVVALKTLRPVPRRLADDLQAVFNAVADLHPVPSDVDDLRPLASAQDGSDLLRRLETLCHRVKTRLDLEGSPVADQKIREFQALVSRRFSEPQLSLDEVSKDLNLSPSYLTKLVRKKLGRSFLDCLTEVRIQQARQLLATTNLMTYEIAEKTGYSDARYFSSNFKKNTGLTPSEFRSRRRDDE